jgi:hypothetical protein
MSKSDYQNLKEAYLSNVKPIRENYGKCYVDQQAIKRVKCRADGTYIVPYQLIGWPDFRPWSFDIWPSKCPKNEIGKCTP